MWRLSCFGPETGIIGDIEVITIATDAIGVHVEGVVPYKWQ